MQYAYYCERDGACSHVSLAEWRAAVAAILGVRAVSAPLNGLGESSDSLNRSFPSIIPNIHILLPVARPADDHQAQRHAEHDDQIREEVAFGRWFHRGFGRFGGEGRSGQGQRQ